MPDSSGKVDHSSLRVNQGTIIVLLFLAFVLNVPWLVLAVAVVMLAGTAFGLPGFFFLYQGVLRPAGIVRPAVSRTIPSRIASRRASAGWLPPWQRSVCSSEPACSAGC